MVDLARQAFSARQFDLAAEIYERSISENGPKKELLLGLADSFAKGRHFAKAFAVYSKAFRVGTISSKDLKHLVSALVNSVKQDSSPLDSEMNKNVMFECLLCQNLLNDPVTIPCGHTFCRPCLLKDSSKLCKICGTVNQHLHVARTKSNVLLCQTIEKWFPDHCKAVRLKKRANTSFQICNFEDAIKLYSEAIEMAPRDHLLWSNRSHAYASLDRYKEALEDAESVLKIRPDWPKGYFRRGCALFGLGRYEESVVSLLQCLALDSSIDTAKDYLSKALHSILSPLSPDDPKSVELQRQLNPSLLDQLIHSNFSSSLLIPSVTVDTVRQLKNIITDTVATATTFLEGHNSGKPIEKSALLEDSHSGTSTAGPHSPQSSKCHSTPTSRSSSPTSCLGKRTHSVSSSLNYGADNVGNFAGDTEVAMATNAEQPVTNKKSDAKMKVNIPYVDPSLRNKDEFECSLCYRLFLHPVSTPCGHMFCRQCLDRVLDHKTECPLCKSDLSEYLAERRQAVTSAVEKLLQAYFPEEFEQRQKQHEDEIAELSSMGLDTQHEIPVFVCTLAYPSVPCPLHIFEPRYRLMIRQCMESGLRQFGMCVATGERAEDFSEYGCMLEIRDVQFFPDGRSLVDTIGGKRFNVISRGHREGYCTAKVEFLKDQPSDNTDELKALSEKVFNLCKTWVDSLPHVQKQQILQHLGECPDMETDGNYGINGTAWHWWMTAVLPLDPRIQQAMLAMTSYKKRLQGLNKVLDYIRNKRDSR